MTFDHRVVVMFLKNFNSVMNDERNLREVIFELLNMLAEINFSLFHVWTWPLWVDGNILSVAYAERDRVFGVFEMWTHL